MYLYVLNIKDNLIISIVVYQCVQPQHWCRLVVAVAVAVAVVVVVVVMCSCVCDGRGCGCGCIFWSGSVSFTTCLL